MKQIRKWFKKRRLLKKYKKDLDTQLQLRTTYKMLSDMPSWQLYLLHEYQCEKRCYERLLKL